MSTLNPGTPVEYKLNCNRTRPHGVAIENPGHESHKIVEFALEGVRRVSVVTGNETLLASQTSLLRHELRRPSESRRRR